MKEYLIKNKRPILLFTVFIIAAVGTYIVLNSSKKPEEKELTEPEEKEPNKIKPKSGPVFPLKQGSNNEFVGKLQAYFNSKYKSGLDVDNKFGPNTLGVVKKYVGLPVVSQLWYNNNVSKK